MLRVLLGLVCFLLVLPTTSLASDSLIRDMEIEIAIQSLSERVFKESRKKAWAAVKKTSLWRKGEALNEAMEPKSKECRRGTREATDYEKAYRAQNRTKIRTGISLSQSSVDEYSYSGFIELNKKMRAMCKEHYARRGSEEYRELSDRWFIIVKKAQALRKRFTAKIYKQEMEKALVDLEIEITEDIQKKVRRSYKQWEA